MNDRGREMSEQIVVRLTPEMLAALRADSDANERTVAQTVRLAVRRFLEATRS